MGVAEHRRSPRVIIPSSMLVCIRLLEQCYCGVGRGARFRWNRQCISNKQRFHRQFAPFIFCTLMLSSCSETELSSPKSFTTFSTPTHQTSLLALRLCRRLPPQPQFVKQQLLCHFSWPQIWVRPSQQQLSITASHQKGSLVSDDIISARRYSILPADVTGENSMTRSRLE